MSEPDVRPGWHRLDIVAPQLHMLLVMSRLLWSSEMSTLWVSDVDVDKPDLTSR